MLNDTPHNLATCRRCRVEHGLEAHIRLPLCPIDMRPVAVHAKDGICAASPSKFVQVGVSQKVRTNVRTPEAWGPRMWAELHTTALTIAMADVPAFIEQFLRRLPCGTCKADAIRWVLNNPPDTAGNASYFAWSVAWHSAVNVKIGKPEMELGEALMRWATSRPVPESS